jgi:hypothetical protein
MAIIQQRAFAIAPNTNQNQSNADIGMDRKGNFVVVWEAPDNSLQGIYSRRFDASGNALGNQVLVNEFTAGTQIAPRVSVGSQGDYMISWQSYGQLANDLWVVCGQKFDQDGNAQGRSLVLRNETSGQYQNPVIALYEDNTFASVFERFRPNSVVPSIEMQVAKLPNPQMRVITDFVQQPFPVDRPNVHLGSQNRPDIVTNQKGDTVVVWSGFGSGDATGIFAQRFNKQGVSQSDVIAVNQFKQGIQRTPSVAIAPNGSFIVAWESEALDGNEYGISARRFNSSGTPMGSEFLVNQSTEGSQRNASVSMGNNGNFVITWESDTSTLNSDVVDVFARYYNTEGRPGSREIRLDSSGVNGYRPAAAMNGIGDFTVVWERDQTNGLQAQQFTLASTIAFDKRNIKVKEGKNAVLTLSRLDETHLRSRVTVDVIGGTATRGEDYRFNKPINVTFKPGQTEQTIRIPILKDSLIEKKETILLEISEKDRAHLDKKTRAKITIIDVPPKGRGRSMDVLLGDEQIAVGKNALKMEQVRSGGSRQPQLFASAENQSIFGQSFDINPFAGKGSVSFGNEVPEAPSLFAPTPTTEAPFALAASAI